MDTYNKNRQIIGVCDKSCRITGKIERWEAHKKGILHRAFSVAIIYKGKYILQHRKHVAFDGVYDLTSSSHPLVVNGKLEPVLDAVYRALKREWGLSKKDLIDKPKVDGCVYYKARDTKSEFTEHEMCDVYTVKVKRLPEPNFDFAYGFSIVTKAELHNKKSRIYAQLSPWTRKMIEKKII